MKVLTKVAFEEIDECLCGKHVFKYHNTSTNTFVLKCGNTKEDFDLKTKKMVPSKKPYCGMHCVYYAERPVFKEIEKTVTELVKFKTFTLEDRLRFLFSFLRVTNRTSIIQEIDNIVQYTLKRQPRKVFYFPSIGHPRVSHRESFDDYQERVFSEPIVDRSEKIIRKVIVPKSKELVEDIETESDNDSDASDLSEADSDLISVHSDLEHSDPDDVEEEVIDDYVEPDEFSEPEYDYDD